MHSRPGSVRIGDLADPQLPDDIVALRESVRELAASLPFDLATLEQQAVAATGLDDFGDDLHREPYAVCLHALATEAGLGPLGRLNAHNNFVQFLSNRLLVVDYLKQHPEANDIEIAAPIIISGLPRTGTTHLHNLMSSDVHLRSMPYWESLEPVPPKSEQGPTFDVDPRWTRCDAMLAMQDHVVPYMRRMHDMYPDHVHEEIQLLAIAGSTMLFDTMAPMPTWREWYKTHDQTPYYLWMKKVLQAMQHQRGPARWVLKSPQHLELFGPLSTAFPDATFVVTHRDPVSVTASLATMITYTARTSQEKVDPVRIGHYWAEIIEDFLRAAVDDHDLLPADRTIDVTFDEFMADDIAMVERIYAVAGQPFTADTRAAMAAFMDDHPRGKWGNVEYHLEDFGLDVAERRSAFTFYNERFGVREETR
jgi:Sulfotransferase family